MKAANNLNRIACAVVSAMLCALILTAATPDTPQVVTPLTELDLVSVRQGWGQLATDRSVMGKPLQIGNRKFATGLGTHANSEVVYDLEHAFERFEAWVGVDVEMLQHTQASVVFKVVTDGREVFNSGVMHVDSPAKRVSVPVKDVSQLKLVVTDAGDGINADHADWAEATLTGQAAVPEKAPAKYEIKAPGLTLQLDKNGGVVGTQVGDAKTAWPLTGGTTLSGFRSAGEVEVSADGRAFTRKLTNAAGLACTVVDRFTPDKEGIKWEVSITSPDPFWTAPLVSRLKCGQPEERLIWTAWGSPDFSGTQLSPELAAKVQAGKASGSGTWSDPLLPVGFLNRTWHYGNVAQGCPVGSDYVALPLFTMLAPATDTGLSLVLSPDDVLLDLNLAISAAGRFQFARANHRFGGGQTVKFTMHLVPHEASWRGGMRFLTARYPQYFEPPNPRVHQLAVCGAYSVSESPIDVAKFKKMAFGFNWKLSDDFPYMGMFIPPVKDADETWTRSCDEKSPREKGPTTSCRQMNNYARYMKQNGFAVLSYFNVTEFGKNMYGRKLVAQADDPALWKDPVAFLKYKLPNAVFDPGIQTCYAAYVVDTGDPDYLNFMLEQADRNTRMLPDTDGICIDRADWLRYYNRRADDGVSWLDGKPARSLFRSWASLMSKLGPQMHQADKVIFANLMTVRLELGRELDGIFTEFGNNGNALNASALLGTRKPVVAWTYNDTLRQPNPDAFMQRHLHLGAFPTAPYPYNNHCITPEPKADQLYLDYGPLLSAMRGKKWVLTVRCVETAAPDVKLNLFEVPGGYALPVTFGGTNESVTVRVRNVSGLDKIKCEVLHPGVEAPGVVSATFKNGELELNVPLKRGCAMVRLMAPSRP